MRNIEPLSKLRLQLSRGQINVDMIISYLAFSIFLLYISHFALNLVNPFISAISFSVRERKFYSWLDSLNLESISKEGFTDLCMLKFDGIDRIKAEYKMLGMKMPARDDYRLANLSDGELLFLRDGSLLEIQAGSNSSNYNASVVISFPSYVGVSIEHLYLENEDNYTTEINEFDELVIYTSLFINGSERDLDILRIFTSSANPFLLSIHSISFKSDGKERLGRVKVGDLKLFSSCGLEGIGRVSHLERFSVLSYQEKSYPVFLSLHAWWD
jgi:hypothetical protein